LIYGLWDVSSPSRFLLAAQADEDIGVLYFCVAATHPYENCSRSDVSRIQLSLPEGKGVRPSQMEMETSNVRGSTQEASQRPRGRFTKLDTVDEEGMDIDETDKAVETGHLRRPEEEEGPRWTLGLALAFSVS
jgi:hypothetical protein